MAVILTSFEESKKLSCPKFSVSVYQPRGFKYPALKFLTATDKDGNKLHLKDLSQDTVKEYEEKLREKYKVMWSSIDAWMKSLRPDDEIALCCWCPHSNTSRKHIEKHGRFFCHTSLIGKMVEKYRPDIEVKMDKDREKNMKETDYKPSIFDHYALKINSNIFSEDIYVVSTSEREKLISKGIKEVVYTIDEIVEMWGMNREDIKEIHEIKKIMGGKIKQV
ncbi:MAG: hypothetical protein IBX72_13700 [Nitrospirae bacterium]|nr:hypothetical protein [Nitrospirota bacterium]